jgi:hypothetical protein
VSGVNFLIVGIRAQRCLARLNDGIIKVFTNPSVPVPRQFRHLLPDRLIVVRYCMSFDLIQ